MLAAAINNHGGHQTTVAHEFHDEVESYRKHVWRCDGPCRERGPYFGEVRRAVNRAPGKRDEWWDRHERERRGKFKKVAGPGAWGAIEKLITKKPTENDEEKNGAKEVQVKEAKTPSRGIHGKRKLEDGWVTETPTRKSSAKRKTVMDAWVVRTPTSPGNSANRRMTGEFADQPDEVLTPSKGRSRSPTQAILNIVPDIHPDDSLVDCPICPARIMEGNINRHLDKVHGFS